LPAHEDVLALWGETRRAKGWSKRRSATKAMHYLMSGYQRGSRISSTARRSVWSATKWCGEDHQFFSMCEHHMLPFFFGKVHIAYFAEDRSESA